MRKAIVLVALAFVAGLHAQGRSSPPTSAASVAPKEEKQFPKYQMEVPLFTPAAVFDLSSSTYSDVALADNQTFAIVDEKCSAIRMQVRRPSRRTIRQRAISAVSYDRNSRYRSPYNRSILHIDPGLKS